ncbi:MAG: flagellar hook assembly protein FlgD [Sphingomonas sp.]|uniref:flagellar hook assembly protein FlgD n=1 Tax=Sphingomonas sp. TaxID=28214 RepID=UPI001AD0A774|nr:flagellar hook capping FlgD N-terminal domain-containing protein [Sphingomonas sp.]MBN8807998.1 flagellar hook assembly protein FlgD [Sphingomonas sp.]
MTSAFDTTLANLGIGRTGSTTPTVAPASSSNQTLGQADFLKLMTAQLQNQDPFNPVDNTQMVAQMAQFSSLQGITDMSTTLKSIAAKLTGTSTTDAMSYVGKNVLTEGNTAYGRTTGGIAGAVELDSDASNVTVTISDGNGQTLKTLNLGKQAKGTATYDWDGTTDAGTAAGSGPFKVSVTAADASGKAVSNRSLVWAPVTAVSNPSSGSPTLSVAGLGTIDVSAVRQIG